MIQKYCESQTHTSAKDITFTIDYKLPAKNSRTIQGKTLKSKTRVNIHLADIIPLVEFSLKSSVFVSLGKVHSQCRGSCIGNPASPPISEVPIAFKEYMWATTYDVVDNESFFLTRYVDNRLIAVPKDLLRHNQWKILTNLMFYEAPVELEPEAGMDFLGFRINTKEATVTYIQPDQLWQFRSVKSAGTVQNLLTGLASRIHLIARHSFPKSNIVPSIKELLASYENIGFQRTDLVTAANQALKLHRMHL